MKYMIFVMAALVLLLGCITPQVPETHEPENITSVEVPVVNEGGPVEKFSIESVNGTFQHTDYEFTQFDYRYPYGVNPFADGMGGNLGKTSTAYIVVGSSNLKFLSSPCNIEQEQAFWFNLKTKDEKGIIFEAAYSVVLMRYISDECATIPFLGKEYEIEVVDKPESNEDKIVRGGEVKLKEVGSESYIVLQDGGSLNNDDKWKVVLGWKNGELVKIIVYMEGYYYDIEEGEEVQLFGSSEVVASFENLDSNPVFKLVKKN